MFCENARTKIADRDFRVLKQLDSTAHRLHCDKKMLVLYTRRLGPSTMMTKNELQRDLMEIKAGYPTLDYLAAKTYFGEVAFYPPLDAAE